MSHGYDRHGFDRGRVTHFKAKKGSLFDEQVDEQFDRAMKVQSAFSIIPTMKNPSLFDKRKDMVSRSGLRTIARSLNTSQDYSLLKPKWNETMDDSINEYQTEQRKASSHFDMV